MSPSDVLLIFIPKITSASLMFFMENLEFNMFLVDVNHLTITTDNKHVIYVQAYNDISMFIVFEINTLVTFIDIESM